MANWTEKYNEEQMEIGRLLDELKAAIANNHAPAFADDPTDSGYVYDLADLRHQLNALLRSFGG